MISTVESEAPWLTSESLSEATKLGLLAAQCGVLGVELNRRAQRHALASELSALKAMMADGKTLEYAVANLEAFLACEDR